MKFFPPTQRSKVIRLKFTNALQMLSNFSKYSCSYAVVKLKCDCQNIFAEKRKPKKEITQRMKLLNLFRISLQHRLMVPSLFLKSFEKIT